MPIITYIDAFFMSIAIYSYIGKRLVSIDQLPMISECLYVLLFSNFVLHFFFIAPRM